MSLPAAPWPREEKLKNRLIRVDRKTGEVEGHEIADLPRLLVPGDLLVLNDAATLPARLFGQTEGGTPLELRLVSEIQQGRWRALVFGEGDWRQRTEDRPAAPLLRPEDNLRFRGALQAKVIKISDLSPRLIEAEFRPLGSDFFRELYEQGHPVQYSYLKDELPLYHVQSAFSSRPWAMELPSAGASLPLGLLMELRVKGIQVVSLTHACGLSSSGDKTLDASWPFGERYEIPQNTVEKIRETRAARGGRVIAAGTSVMRALEGNVMRHGGFLKSGVGETDLLIGPGYPPKIVEGLLTGLHEVEESHFRLAASLLSELYLKRVLEFAEKEGLLSHEFGDECLIL